MEKQKPRQQKTGKRIDKQLDKGKTMNKKSSFMTGRNGPDALAWFLAVLALILNIVVLFTPYWFVALLPILPAVFALVRIFSRNVAKCQKHNAMFLALFGGRKENQSEANNGEENKQGYNQPYRQNQYEQQNAYQTTDSTPNTSHTPDTPNTFGMPNTSTVQAQTEAKDNMPSMAFSCPACHKKMRCRLGIGVFSVTCPVCGHTFSMES